MPKWNLKDNSLFQYKYWNVVADTMDHITYDEIIHYDTVKILRILDMEAEILLDGNFIKKHSCSCAHWNSIEPCEHVLKIVALIREKKVVFKEIQKVSESYRSYKKLDIKNILNDITTDELIYFVKDYAKKNANFNHQLLTHFAYKLSSNDHDEKYDSLFLKVFNQPKDKQNYLTATSFRQFTKLYISFSQQLKILCTLEDYLQAYSLLKISIFYFNKSLPLIRKDHVEEISAIFSQFLDSFTFESQLSISPTLLELYQLELLDWSGKRSFVNKGLSVKLMQILLSFRSSAVYGAVVELLEKEILSISDLKYRSKYESLYLFVSFIHGSDYQSDLVSTTHFDTTASLALDYFLENHMYLESKRFLTYLGSLGLNTDDQLLKIHILENDKSSIIKLSKALFERKKDIKYVEILSKVMSQTVFNNWKSKVNEQLLAEGNIDLVIEILLATHDHDALKGLLLQQADMTLWIEHAPKIKLDLTEVDFKLLHIFIDAYLDEHLGKKSSDKIRMLLNKLRHPQNEKLIQKINDQVIARYIGRPSISNMLKEDTIKFI
jgi:hypothetical protein